MRGLVSWSGADPFWYGSPSQEEIDSYLTRNPYGDPYGAAGAVAELVAEVRRCWEAMKQYREYRDECTERPKAKIK